MLDAQSIDGDFAPSRSSPPQPHDAAVAAVLAAASVALLLMTVNVSDGGQTTAHDPDALGVALCVIACAMVAVRRPFPVTTALVALAAAGIGGMLGYSVAIPLVTALVLAGNAAIHADRAASWLVGAYTGIQIAGMAVGTLENDAVLRAIGGFAVGLVPVLVGRVIRTERTRTAEARELARRTAELRDRDVEHAVAQERLRIARDVHDITGHHLSAISLQAGGAGRQTSDPVARAALERIHRLTTEALGQTRRALGILRANGPAALTPAPRLAHVDELLAPARDAGLAVDLQLSGRARPLSDELEACAYRVVQESLTNVVRHAGAREVVVRVEYGDQELRLAVDDDGVGGPPRRHGGGIDGMRERVALVGGGLDAGPAGRGWSVRATLPLEAVA
ncbi:sensor histidine kinase [Conexibacter sp. CPCC 206217]|uniref:sensor histidine kinase n=1 Tax=Conexibacter sp. CPCC 206217 TaxID=3064574 RepID=UPI00272494AB|nr:histidine kinase [Conexibacter sp. CPCC 206217]MDO8212641.1 histidine kinase [Conexibacter sp. CPCC 206217]